MSKKLCTGCNSVLPNGHTATLCDICGETWLSKAKIAQSQGDKWVILEVDSIDGLDVKKMKFAGKLLVRVRDINYVLEQPDGQVFIRVNPGKGEMIDRATLAELAKRIAEEVHFYRSLIEKDYD